MIKVDTVGISENIPDVLHDIQQHFKCYIFDDSQKQIVADITETPDLDKQTRLAIYANAYIVRLIEVLESDYSAIAALLGEEDFSQLATEYIQQHPSTFYTLRFFGRYMPAFIQQHPTYAAHPSLAELAVFEWAFIEAFDSADTQVVSEADVANVPVDAWPTLQFKFHPSLQVVPYEWNIIPLWQATGNDEELPQLEKLEQKNACIVWRDGLLTQFRSLDIDERIALDTAKNNGTFSDLCEQLTEFEEVPQQAAMRAAGLMKGWITSGLITKLIY